MMMTASFFGGGETMKIGLLIAIERELEAFLQSGGDRRNRGGADGVQDPDGRARRVRRQVRVRGN